MSHHDELTTIDPATLDEVAGGVTASSNAQLTTALQGITSSLAAQPANNSNSLSSMLPFMLMLGKGGATGGACPCGCGMANCMRR
jgi:hypothetical protein